MKYDELRELARYASPGPWTSKQDHVYQARGWELAKTFNLPQDHNAAYIAAASPDVILALLDERERLREALNYASRVRHDFAHNGDIYRGGDFENCALCQETRVLLGEPVEATP